MKSTFILFLSWFLIFFGACKVDQIDTPERPNIVLIMADDMGYSDIGCYGGEIETPNINRLAQEGMRFRSFYNMAKCNPTRSSMLTGRYYGGPGVMHLAQLTKKAGYYNIMSGKEHLDAWVPEYCRAENVFDHSFYFWATTEYFLPPSGSFERPFYLEGKEIGASDIEYDEAPMYKTDFITDYALRWLDEGFDKQLEEDESKPFFLYLPYHAAHYPLQARPEDIAKYRGKYLKGWDVLRQERYERMNDMGILPQNAVLSPPEKSLNKLRGPLIKDYIDYNPWDKLNDAEKDSLDLEMAVYAAIVDRMDQNIGRVFSKLEEEGVMDNTIILFLIDNGACAFYANKVKDVQPGPADSYWSLRTSWANLANTPYRQYKQCGHEGGGRTPFIVRWPDHIEANSFTDQIGHVVDIAPTFQEVLDVTLPDSIKGYERLAFHGASLLPVFKGEERTEPKYILSGLDKFRMYRSGDYKIVRMNGGRWELYNMVLDPTELNDLAKSEPVILDQIVTAFNEVDQHLNKTSFALTR